ncbi:hypothetical protein HDU76_013085 [Blyttiomyces sp. JEL0837]|nr:hypothetical protein HDU76_013085 [Blyttiomyces sp. JEL0837]
MVNTTTTTSTTTPSKPNPNSKAYLIGGGIGGLSSAVYMIRHGNMKGENITIFEDLPVIGGSMDAHGDHKDGYLMRGGRMFDREAYTCLYDVLSEIPSLDNPGKTAKQDIYDFSDIYKTDSHARLIDTGCVKVDASKLGISLIDKARFGEFLILPEALLDGKNINEFFTEDFFKTNFWFCFRSTFAFQPWHSLTEFRRYCLRFMHEVPKLYNLSGVWRTPFNQYDSIILPITKWLEEQGVKFEYNTRVTNMDFEVAENGERSVYRLYLQRNKGPTETLEIPKTDLVFTTLGSLTAAASIGTTHSAPPQIHQTKASQDPTWSLWSEIARKQPDFGRPDVFHKDVDASKFESFSCTFKDPTFINRMISWSENEPGTGALVTFKDSNWGMSLVVPHQPHFRGQPDNIQVMWGYGLFPDQIGNFVKKPMKECTGEELLKEALHFLHFEDIMETVLATTTTIPSMLPYTMAQFVTRKPGDRPLVVPKGAVNFAFLGQFVEVPEDVVFTVEYSVRCAQIATFKLLGLDREVTPIYKGWRDPAVMVKSAMTVLNS